MYTCIYLLMYIIVIAYMYLQVRHEIWYSEVMMSGPMVWHHHSDYIVIIYIIYKLLSSVSV